MARLVGEKVVLREYRAEDLSAIRAWVNDKEVTRYLGSAYRRVQTWEQTEEMLSRRLNGETGGEAFVIGEKQTGKYLGQCDLMMIDSVARKAEMAVVLMKDQQGKGYALESVALLLKYAFEEMNLERVWLKCAEKNERAVKLYERAGFQKEGILRRDLYIDGEYVNTVVMGKLKSDI